MSQFSYSFCLSLFHSFWQAALLLACYAVLQPFLKKQLPSFKRNLLYALLFTQVIVSCLTFMIYYNGYINFYKDLIESSFSVVLEQQPLVEKIAPGIISFYAMIIVFKSIYLVNNWYRFKSFCNDSLIKPSIDLKIFTLTKANQFGIKRKVTLWFSDVVSTPLTFGFLKPVILMPVALLNHLSLAEAESLIIHELTHIKNNDYFLNWLLVIIETMFFYNPFISIITRKIKLEREKNCDVQVLLFKYPVISYAETLLKTAKFKSNINFFPLAAVFKNKQLLQRIRFFSLDQNLDFSKKRLAPVSFIALIGMVLMNLFIIFQVKQQYAPAKNFKVSDELQMAYVDVAAPAAVQPEFMPVNEAAFPISVKNDANMQLSLNKQREQLNDKLKIVSAAAEKIAAESAALSYAMPVVNIQTEEQEVIVKEESSGTNESITKAYKLKLKDGKWVDELKYILKEGKPVVVLDSLCNKIDSVITLVPMQ